MINKEVPGMKRVSSGNTVTTEEMLNKMGIFRTADFYEVYA